MLYPTRRCAKSNRHRGEKIVPVYSRLRRCRIKGTDAEGNPYIAEGCFCIPTPRRRVGFSLVLK